MTEEAADLSSAATESWWYQFDRIFWERACLSPEKYEHDAALELYRNRDRLHAYAEDFADLEPEIAVLRMFERGITA